MTAPPLPAGAPRCHSVPGLSTITALVPATPKVPLGDLVQPLPTGGTSQDSLDALRTEGLCPPKTDMWMPKLQADSTRRRGFWEVIRPGALVNRISVLVNEAPESSLVPFAVGGCSGRRGVHEPGRALRPDTRLAGALTLDCEGRMWKPHGGPQPELRHVPSPALRLRLPSLLAVLAVPAHPQKQDLPLSITPLLVRFEQRLKVPRFVVFETSLRSIGKSSHCQQLAE